MLSVRNVRLFSTAVNGSASIKRVGVIGSGKMGTGIALMAAAKGFDVTLHDIGEEPLQRSLAFMDKLLTKDVRKEKITAEDQAEILGRVTTSVQLESLRDTGVDFVVEAATEDLVLKQKIFQDLSNLMPANVILGTNTSSISVTKIAAASDRPDKVIGMHFFQPVTVMKIVEIISGLETSEETLATTLGLAERLGKTTSRSKDMPGFIANRLLMPYINEAILVLQEGTATAEDIDVTMKLGCALPMGPLRLADFIGLDTCLSIMTVLHDGFGDSKYRPAPLLQQYVDAGLTGEKSGRGFYTYD